MYNREKAISYAKKWALDRNKKYADFSFMGGDCTNYISQCLFAGGIKQAYSLLGWFYSSLSNRAPAWTGVDELFNFAINNYSNHGPMFILSNIEKMEEGDIIQINTNNIWSHTLIITKIIFPPNVNNIFICAHSFDALNKPLSSYNYSKIRYLKVIN